MAKRDYQRRTDPEFEAFNRKVGEKIKDLRRDKNLSQEQFALEANIDRTHVSYLETSRSDPTLSTLFKVAKALGMSVSELLEVD